MSKLSHKDLNEGFAICIFNRDQKAIALHPVIGKQLDDSFAVTYNDFIKMYNITLIGTGMRVSIELGFLSDVMERYDRDKEQWKTLIKQANVKKAREKYEWLIKKRQVE